ncbi:MAG: DNA polymerase IV [Verrucomicrobia bacterium]|nr:DNA polymerase IV [Verrucomicrobiota bacterium]
MDPAPRICCLDLDTFFVSVERLFDPSLVGRAVVVGGERGGRGVVTSASYEARAFGVRSGMSIRDASALAPTAVFLPGRHDEYTRHSAAAREIVERYSPLVRAASIDEQYVDFHGCERLYQRPSDRDGDATILRVVREITATIARELGLPASAGIASNKSMAKVASGLAKPRGVLLVPAGREAETLAPLPVRKLPGIGPVAEKALVERGVATLGALVAADHALLAQVFGRRVDEVRRAAAGHGEGEVGRERPAFREHDPVGERVGSISNERTFVERRRGDAAVILAGLCERVAWRARRRGVKARTVTLKLRYEGFETLARSATGEATACDVEIHRRVSELYGRHRDGARAVRLVGVALSNLELAGAQLLLFDQGERRAIAVDRVREKFGYSALHLAGSADGGRDEGDGGAYHGRR